MKNKQQDFSLIELLIVVAIIPTLYSMFYGKSKGYSADVLNRLCATLHCKPGDLLRWEQDRFSRHKK